MADRVPLAEQISEVKREMSMRAYVYPSLVERGKITQSEANKRQARLEAVLTTLVELSKAERLL